MHDLQHLFLQRTDAQLRLQQKIQKPEISRDVQPISVLPCRRLCDRQLEFSHCTRRNRAPLNLPNRQRHQQLFCSAVIFEPVVETGDTFQNTDGYFRPEGQRPRDDSDCPSHIFPEVQPTPTCIRSPTPHCPAFFPGTPSSGLDASSLSRSSRGLAMKFSTPGSGGSSRSNRPIICAWTVLRFAPSSAGTARPTRSIIEKTGETHYLTQGKHHNPTDLALSSPGKAPVHTPDEPPLLGQRDQGPLGTARRT